jgi:phosphatidylinositol alpha-1,6-mannosyltransferase
LQRATLVAACSRFTAEAVVALGVPRSRVRVAYPGVDTTRFSPRPDPELLGSSEPRAQSPEPPRLLTVSRLHERYKGHDTVIRALPLVLARHPGTRYVIVGDGPLRAYLARLAQSLGVEQAVRFRGEEPDDLLPSLYRACDVFVQLSREALVGGGAEGFGIACLEAAACGKPVVAGRSGGLPDAVQDGTTGVLVDPDDVADAADAIVALLDDAERARRLGEAGRARVLERFTWDHVLAQARRVFEEACASSS